MLDWMLNHPWHTVAAIIVLMSTLCVVPYYVVSRIRSEPFPGDVKEMALNVGFRIGSLHALILALIFSGTQDEYQKARETIAAEVIILVEVAHEIAGMRDLGMSATLSKLEQYVDALQEDDAPAMGVGNIQNSDLIFREASRISSEIYNDLLSFEPEDSRRKITLERIVSKLDQAFTLRLERLASAARGISSLFWILSAAGFLLVLVLFYVIPFTWMNAIFVACYGSYTGIILYFIIEMNNPYIGLSSIDLDIVKGVFRSISQVAN